MAKHLGLSKNAFSSNGTTSMREDRARAAQIRREIAESKNGSTPKQVATGNWVDTKDGSTTKK